MVRQQAEYMYMGLRAEKNKFLYDKHICDNRLNSLLRVQKIRFLMTNFPNLIKQIKTLNEIENLLQCISNSKLF